MKIQIIENTTDTIVANVGNPIETETDTTIIVAEYWKDENKFVIYMEVFDLDGHYLDSIDDHPLTSDEVNEVKTYLLKH